MRRDCITQQHCGTTCFVILKEMMHFRCMNNRFLSNDMCGWRVLTSRIRATNGASSSKSIPRFVIITLIIPIEQLKWTSSDHISMISTDDGFKHNTINLLKCHLLAMRFIQGASSVPMFVRISSSTLPRTVFIMVVVTVVTSWSL